MKTRRNLLAAALVAASLCALGASLRSQAPDMSPQQPRPTHEPPANEGPVLPDAEKKALEDNDKNMKKKVERLYQLASELKDQVDKTDSSKVLSLDLIKKAEEIEKLAHDIKNRSKG
jgi:peptidoglycan hydrolase CwlO-like protein